MDRPVMSVRVALLSLSLLPLVSAHPALAQAPSTTTPPAGQTRRPRAPWPARRARHVPPFCLVCAPANGWANRPGGRRRRVGWL